MGVGACVCYQLSTQVCVCVLVAVCKLSPSEFPCKVAESGHTILLRKWVFSTQQVSPSLVTARSQAQTVCFTNRTGRAPPLPPQQEGNLFGDPRAVDLLFDQAIADLEAGKLEVDSSLQETLDSARTNPVKVKCQVIVFMTL